MSKASRSPRRAGIAAIFAALIICAAVFLVAAGELRSGGLGADAQLVSVRPLPDSDGPMCQWMPASASQTLAMALQQDARAASPDTGQQTIDLPDMKPVRRIHDPYSGYSSIAVDDKDDEVVMTDENLFQIVVYDRLTNTPPSATMSEPKRAIGGLNTKIEFQCGVYVDPMNGNIYGVNNDTVDTLVIFSRDQNGNVIPAEQLHTPHGTFGIAVDEGAGEMYLSEEHDSAVVVFHKNAAEDDSPIRLLQGDKTLLADPHGVALDVKDQLLFVANIGAVHSEQAGKGTGRGERGGEPKQNWPLDRAHAIPGSGRNMPPSVTIYALKASGDTAPLRVITGPKTLMDWPTGLAVDPERGEIYVSNDMTNSILVFDINANGDVAPKRVLGGPKTLLSNPTGIYLDLKNDELWSSNFGNHTATVYPLGAGGDITPLRVIRSAPMSAPVPEMGNPHPVAFDSKRQQILVPNCVAHPQIAIFARLEDNDAKPVRRVAGQKTLLGRTMHSIAYDSVHDEFVVPQQFGQAILTFRGGTSGEEPPIRVIQGSNTQLQDPDHLAMDPVHGEIYVPQGNKVLVFDRLAIGNAAPIRVIKGPDTGLGASVIGDDPVNGYIIVAGGGGGGGSNAGTKIRFFDRLADGNVKPELVITGPRSLGGPFAVYPPKKLIIATDLNGRGELASPDSYMGIWSYAQSGSQPPLWRIGGPHGIFQMPRGVTLDVKDKDIIVTDKRLNSVLTFHFPDMF